MSATIELKGTRYARILGTNITEYQVESGSRVRVSCKSGRDLPNVEWKFPKVDQNMAPEIYETPKNEYEVYFLLYGSIQPSNAGVHCCRVQGVCNISNEINLQVVDSISHGTYRYLLPHVRSYDAVAQPGTWEVAGTYCAADDAQLAVPSSQKELDTLMEVASFEDRRSPFWLGVLRTGIIAAVRGQRYDNGSGWGSVSFANELRGSCTALHNKELLDNPCKSSYRFFCKHTPANASCWPGYRLLLNSSCVSLSTVELSWTDAREYCRNNGTDLAVPDSVQEIDEMGNVDNYPVWVGLYRINERWITFDYKTVDATDVTDFTDWLPDILNKDGDGDGDCVFLNGSEVSTANCEKSLPYICERNYNPVAVENRTPADEGYLPLWAIILISVLGVMAAIFIPVSVVQYIKKRSERALRHNLLHGNWDDKTSDSPFMDILRSLPYSERWEFPVRHLRLGKVIGAGEFGIVRKGFAGFITPTQTVRTVAVKTVQTCADISCLKALVLEMKVLSHLGQHLNVVNLLGACTMDLGKGKLQVILEYCPFGNLRSYLIHNETEFVDLLDPITGAVRWTGNTCRQDSSEPGTSGMAVRQDEDKEDFDCEAAQTLWVSVTDGASDTLSTQDLLKWSYQISKGMDYLTGRKVMHGDLAARNVLLTHNNVVKICDFGLSRSLSNVAYYKKTGNNPLPIKWLSPEALLHQKFSTQSDVWAFGILLWELFTLGGSPYPGVEPRELYTRLQDGYRMDKPKMAPEEIYLAMQRCWLADPQERPSFSVLVQNLGDLLEESVVQEYIKCNDPHMRLNEANQDRDYLKDLPEPTFSTSSLYTTSPQRAASARGPLPPIPVEETRM